MLEWTETAIAFVGLALLLLGFRRDVYGSAAFAAGCAAMLFIDDGAWHRWVWIVGIVLSVPVIASAALEGAHD